MAKKEYQVRSAKVVLNLEEIQDGKLTRVQEIPVVILEAQFDQTTLTSLAAQLLEQVNGLPESNAEGEGDEG